MYFKIIFARGLVQFIILTLRILKPYLSTKLPREEFRNELEIVFIPSNDKNIKSLFFNADSIAQYKIVPSVLESVPDVIFLIINFTIIKFEIQRYKKLKDFIF